MVMTTEVALKLSKKYKSVRLYLHWPNVPTLTLLPRCRSLLQITVDEEIARLYIVKEIRLSVT